jgi:hypothetical protein
MRNKPLPTFPKTNALFGRGGTPRPTFLIFAVLLALAGCTSRQRVISQKTIYYESSHGEANIRASTSLFSPNVRIPERPEPGK